MLCTILCRFVCILIYMYEVIINIIYAGISRRQCVVDNHRQAAQVSIAQAGAAQVGHHGAVGRSGGGIQGTECCVPTRERQTAAEASAKIRSR